MVRTDVSLFPFPLLFRPGAQALPPTTFASELNRTVSCTTATRGDMRDTACDRGTAGDGAPGGGLLETCSPPSESCSCCTFQHTLCIHFTQCPHVEHTLTIPCVSIFSHPHTCPFPSLSCPAPFRGPITMSLTEWPAMVPQTRRMTRKALLKW